jgi:hypothetical protein
VDARDPERCTTRIAKARTYSRSADRADLDKLRAFIATYGPAASHSPLDGLNVLENSA